MNSAKQEQLNEVRRLLSRLLMERVYLDIKIEGYRERLHKLSLQLERGPSSQQPAKSRKRRAKK